MRAVSDDYQPRTLDELADQALLILGEQGDMRCGLLGSLLFKDAARLRGSAPFARIAGKVVRRLLDRGHAGCTNKGTWELTYRGRQEYAKLRG